MSTTRKPANVTMVRDDLKNIPVHRLPKPYKIRMYRPGDEETWFRIWTLADEKYRGAKWDTFARDFGSDAEVLGKRQFYLCDGAGKPIGTASAWFKDEYKGKSWGLVHWVAIIREAQGKGLAKPLMVRVMKRLKELRHSRAMLVTQYYRVPAIKLYLDLGFMPEVSDEHDRALWRKVRESLGESVLNKIDLGDK